MDKSIDQATKNREDIANIKRLYVTGEISRDEAKMLAQPILARVNKATAIKTKQLNRKYDVSRKPAYLDFINAMRNSY